MVLDNIIFIHPPRCSGTSIEASFNWHNEREKHLKASAIRQKLEKDKWEYIDDVSISEFVEGDDRPFVDPRPNRRRR